MITTPAFTIGDVIRTGGGKTPWRIDEIGPGTDFYTRGRTVYRCVSLTSGRREEHNVRRLDLERWDKPLPAPASGPLPGHGLQREGGPFTADGTYANRESWNRSGPGRALCACGELSDDLPSAGARKRWHKAHKDAIRAKQDA